MSSNPGRHRDRLRSGNLDLHQLHLLGVEGEARKRGAVAFGQRQARGSRSTGSPNPRTIRRRGPSPPGDPSAHARLSRRLPAGEIHSDRHRSLLEAHLAYNQSALLQRCGLESPPPAASPSVCDTLQPPPSSFTATETLTRESPARPSRSSPCSPGARLERHLGLRHSDRGRVRRLRNGDGLGIDGDLPSRVVTSGVLAW